MADHVKTTCYKNGVCVVTVIKDADDDAGSVNTSPGCRWKGRSVDCVKPEGALDASTGCYLKPADPPPTSGPVAAEYKAHGGAILWKTCPFGGISGFIWRPAGEARPQVTAAMVRAQAQRLVPTAAVGLAPHGSTLVNIETVMWADAPVGQVLPTVTLLGRSVVIRLRLVSVAWTFGDGRSDPDGPAGKAYDNVHAPCRARTCADYFGHVYTRTGRVVVGAVVSWRASFTVDGGPVQQVDGVVPGPGAQATIQVKQARALLVPNPGEH